MKEVTVVIAVALMFLLPVVAQADVFGLGPTVAGNGPALCADQRGASGPLPSTISGLEGYALFGKNAGAAAAVTYKHRFYSIATKRRTCPTCGKDWPRMQKRCPDDKTKLPVGDHAIRCRYGLLGGVIVADENARGLLGGFAEAEAEGIAGLVLIVRFDDGVVVNPGIKVNFLSLSW